MIGVRQRLARLHAGAGERGRAEIPALQGALETRFKRSEGGSGNLGACFSAAC
jgi:hypothetical protein